MLYNGVVEMSGGDDRTRGVDKIYADTLSVEP